MGISLLWAGVCDNPNRIILGFEKCIAPFSLSLFQSLREKGALHLPVI